MGFVHPSYHKRSQMRPKLENNLSKEERHTEWKFRNLTHSGIDIWNSYFYKFARLWESTLKVQVVTDDMILDVDNPKESTKKPSALINLSLAWLWDIR